MFTNPTDIQRNLNIEASVPSIEIRILNASAIVIYSIKREVLVGSHIMLLPLKRTLANS